ncbi:endonuclease/exonuclease/phosphatase family protein [Halorussus sp. MSC15.2]|uniref:endonuclease/exonuclease/phosphatase family protein n=1 Tax=Halorussus sp. MSC15.2 TaxID=2283638 RepID=UPI0013D6BE5D|nr:endonuclease/exonuclease/phosphatase family protein [Halorussus sp. MSC15.2]NEU59111.1 endonuclease/exonuclease/phosphatase family protein [Halorussus sp. MSC15.2]
MSGNASESVDFEASAPSRVMSFNVRYDTDSDGEHAWPERKEMVASVLRFHKPDLVGLQEPLKHQLDYIDGQTPGIEWVGVGRADGDTKGEHVPIGYRPSRFELLDTSTFWLSESPTVAGSVGWNAARPRIVTWAKLRDTESQTRFYLFNTHLDHRGDTARVESARLLRRRASDIAGSDPVVVTGDLNCTKSDGPYRELTAEEQSGWQLFDAKRESENGHYGPTVTFDAFEGEPDAKIDYVFATDDVSVYQHGIVRERWDDRPPSDHFPVLADVCFEGSRERSAY